MIYVNYAGESEASDTMSRIWSPADYHGIEGKRKVR